ncbi:hypothetical protein Acsp03_70720 [Actinomadura sp. NBRC 104412]|uniref:hypothetical protein n=1 Tax=Actinomadura sp. NBRC 104412 TaxID=3032203 RepID=UPI00249F9F23|nr:hypothetical protein [Actinomadura sp. NBRC 104412]GLZ09606.1 hypothetical protein Acsp03_70720 [Actinomadura sp. NBRC 104412]
MSDAPALLREAAARLRMPLPGDLTARPRLVMTDAETISGIAFCADHLLPCNEEQELSACNHCEVIDCLHERLAELLHRLLAAREPLAAWLDAVAGGWEMSAELAPGGSGARFARHPAFAVARSIVGPSGDRPGNA